jgi:glycerol-3-phosphate dehydrogenase subunit B
MPICDDVVVVGGGLAGLMAALAAAESGAQVRLISHKKSTLRQASGLVDVLGAVDGDAPIADPFAAVDRLPEDHGRSSRPHGTPSRWRPGWRARPRTRCSSGSAG